MYVSLRQVDNMARQFIISLNHHQAGGTYFYTTPYIMRSRKCGVVIFYLATRFRDVIGRVADPWAGLGRAFSLAASPYVGIVIHLCV